MLPDLDISDINLPDIFLSGELAGLEIYRCAVWDVGDTHGGIISDVQITDGKDAVFQRVSREDNRNGVTNYYKTFWKNGSGSSWPDVRAVVEVNATISFPRESVSIAIGTAGDDMSNKPNDSAFGMMSDTVSSLSSGDAIPVWIRQVISGSPGGEMPDRGQDVQISIVLQEV